jgi:cytochrome c
VRWVRGVGPVSALCLVASLLLAHVHPFGNAGLYAATAPQALARQTSIPPGARSILIDKCSDCHSTQTRTPFYGHFAPISWLLERDIVEARKAMNLSQWNTFSPDQQQTFEAKIVQETKTHEMPLPQYRLIHWNAGITAADLHTLTQWAHNTPSDGAITQALTPGDPIRGRLLFEKRCTGCHALNVNHEGPQLQGIYNRPTGSIPNFPYSDALKNAHITWNDRTLDQWLTDPDAFLPGNNMDFLVPKPQERQDIIAYFKQSAGR